MKYARVSIVSIQTANWIEYVPAFDAVLIILIVVIYWRKINNELNCRGIHCRRSKKICGCEFQFILINFELYVAN